MSREIKYRVWDNENKSYNDPYSYAYYALTQDGGLDFYCHGDHMDEADPDVYFVELSTGVKDKNGKEIYEGDILGGIWESGFISWCEKCKQFQYHSAGIGCMACSGDVHWCEIVEDDGKLEVIGNIHENRGLLEEEEE